MARLAALLRQIAPQDKIEEVVRAFVIALFGVFVFGEQGFLFEGFDVINQAFFKAAGESSEQVDQRMGIAGDEVDRTLAGINAGFDNSAQSSFHQEAVARR